MRFQPVKTGMDRQPYDAAYKYLFSSPRIACQLLHSFVDIPLVKKIEPGIQLILHLTYIVVI